MIKEFEFYHGVVFTKLIHSANENVIIKPYPTISNASYVVNDNVGMYIKHSSGRMSPWRFVIQKIHQDEIWEMKKHLPDVFLILVCGEDGIVTLNFDDLEKILPEENRDTAWISAARNPHKEYTVKGSGGDLDRKVGKTDFPKRIIEAIFI